MTPIKLEWQAFGPFRDYASIDFTELSSQGPFLITGKTGAGKTTILDALCFALYGKGSGAQRSDFEEMRCKTAAWGTDTFVIYTFEINGNIFRFERRLECKKKLLTPTFNAEVKNPDGIFEPLFEKYNKQDMTNKAEELLGLSYDQFRQVVILPQGKFEEFLVAKPEEKGKILSSIFGIDKWQKIADAYFETAQNNSRALSEKRQIIETTVKNENTTSVEELKEHIELLKKKQVSVQQELLELDYDNKRKALSDQKELCTQFDHLDGLYTKKNELQEKREQVDIIKTALDIATRAEKVRNSIQDCEDKTAAEKTRKDFLDEKEADLVNAGKAAETANTELNQHMSKKEGYNAEKARKTILDGKRTHYEELTTLTARRDSAEKEYNKAKSDKERAEHTKEIADNNCGAKYAALNEANSNYDSAMQAYMADVAGTMAASLAEGEPCPVCGSIHHPTPASSTPNTITRDKISELEKKRKNAHKAWEDADNERKSADDALNSANIAFGDADKAFDGAKQAVEQAKKEIEPGIDTIEELDKEIKRLEESVQDYEKQLDLLTNAFNAAKEALTAAETGRDTARDEYEAAGKAVSASMSAMEVKIAENGFADIAEVKNQLKDENTRLEWVRQIQEYETNVANIEKSIEEQSGKLEGKDRPDRETLERIIEELDTARNELTDESNDVKRELLRLEPIISNLCDLQEEIDSKQTQVSDDLQFAKKLRGDTGIGLHRYVLSVMFKSVIYAANRMLEKVHNGRYQLFDSVEGGTGNKKGLEVAVHDSWAPDGGDRSARSLSGGEKFLVSLALSIGLSEIAQKNGTRLGTLFVDEGFGSLDEDSIEDALSILYSVTKANGTVGIISHVDVVRDSISTKVEVNKADETRGSSLEIIIG